MFEVDAATKYGAFKALNAERIQPYVEKAASPAEALHLYAWNAQISAALLETISHFEVSYRNTLDSALTGRHIALNRQSDWLDDPHRELTHEARDEIAKARERAQKQAVPTRGHVIAELNFSFWRRLIDSRYSNTWGRHVISKYKEQRKNSGQRNDMTLLVGLVQPIYYIRNRVAHHEPIFHLNPKGRRDDMLALIRAQSTDLSKWVHSRCRLDELMEPKPVVSGANRAP